MRFLNEIELFNGLSFGEKNEKYQTQASMNPLEFTR